MAPSAISPSTSPSRSKLVDSRDAVFRSLKGQTIRMPDLRPIFADWKGTYVEDISPYVEELRAFVRERLGGLYFDEAKRKRLEAADFGYFTAVWWPAAGWAEIQALAELVIWLFTWDDEIDEPTGFCTDDFEAAQIYRDQTLRFVRWHLGLAAPEAAEPQPQNDIIQSFDVIGAALRTGYAVDQCQRFYEEISRFMAASEREQRLRLAGKVPTLEEYWSFRLGTSAVYIGSAAGEFSIPSHLPPHVMNAPSMQGIWDETNVIISITNDLLSLKKEMKQACIDSIVPLTYVHTEDVQRAVAEAYRELEDSKQRFDAHDEDVTQLVSNESDLVRQHTARFIAAQRSNCIGNLVWSLRTRRYNMAESADGDGSQTFVL